VSETTTNPARPIDRVGPAAEFEQIYRSHVGAVTAFFARRSAEPQTVADLWRCDWQGGGRYRTTRSRNLTG
jgi:hypothetical protein